MPVLRNILYLLSGGALSGGQVPAALMTAVKYVKRANNNADALLFTHKVCVEAPQTLRSHRRIRLREIILSCLRAKRFDMKVKVCEIRVFPVFHTLFPSADFRRIPGPKSGPLRYMQLIRVNHHPACA